MFNRSKRPKNPFESRTEIWRQVGLGSEIDPGSAQRARGGAIAIGLLIAAVLIVFANRRTLFPGGGDAVRVITVIALVVLGSALARQLGRGAAPTLMRRLDPGVAGTLGFAIRLMTVVIAFHRRGADRGARRRRTSPPEAPSRPSSSASPRSRPSATSSPAWWCFPIARSESATASDL